MLTRRHWIPPAGLAFAQLSAGVSWVLLYWIATHGDPRAFSPQALAWIHVVALGWFTMAAFSILLHAIPAFVDVDWDRQGIARWALAVGGAAIAALIVAFLTAPQQLGIAAAALAIAFAVYLAGAFGALRKAFGSEDRIDRAVARAFFFLLLVFALVMLLGLALAWMLAGAHVPAWFGSIPVAHADLALFGWLASLIYGVSARTLRPITGTRTRFPKIHIVVGSATFFGAFLLAAGAAVSNVPLSWVGAAFVLAGGVAYVVDVGDILSRSENPHHPPQAFVGVALFWLVNALVAGGGALAGYNWQALFVFELLVGFAANMVTAHVFHIGVRLIATVKRGDDDETRPQELLDVPLEWIAFGLFQAAIALVVVGLLFGIAAGVQLGALLGLLAWATTIAALARAAKRASA